MQPEQPRVRLTKEWLQRVEQDLGVAERVRDEAAFAEVVAFHAQQAVEKALKAFLAWHDLPFRQTHNLEELAQQCTAMDSAFGALVPRVAPLTPYVTAGRYPFSPVTITTGMAQEALSFAIEVRDFVLERLSLEA